MLQLQQVDMENIYLFKGIKEVGLDALLGYLQAKPYVFKKDEVVWKQGVSISSIAVVLVGEVKLSKIGFNGKETLYSYVKDGEVFGANFLCAGLKKSPLQVKTLKQTGVLFIPFERLIKFDEYTARWNAQLIKNLFELIGLENLALERRMLILKNKSIKEKILAYLDIEAQELGAREFKIEYSREQMAEYLGVDRSALSRELSNLQKEGVLEYRKNEFKLLG